MRPSPTNQPPDEKLRFPSREGNRLKILVNGDAIFSSMLTSIEEAKIEILLETYIYWDGEIGKRFAEALARVSRRGVSVRVVLDAYGSLKLGKDLVEIMKRGGVEVRRHRPVHWMNLRKSNHRSHRKLMIVDGQIGFIGGVGIADEWMGQARNPNEWRDNHYRIEGPVVRDLHSLFFTHWNKSRDLDPCQMGEHQSSHLPGSIHCRLIASDPLHGQNQFVRAYQELINKAEKNLKIISPYFVPGDDFLELLVKTAKRGVSVEIITAGKYNDRRVVRQASRFDWGTLLEAGIGVYEYHKTLIHVKLILIDEDTLLVGSANFDVRSERLNEEASLLIKDQVLAAEHHRLFEEDRTHCVEARIETWNSRPLKRKILDWFAHLLRSFL